MILVIDNYDSFVHNLARYVRELGAVAHVIRNDAISVADCLAAAPAGLILSPGPRTPAEAGICLDLIAALPRATPLLGVCLGHQCLVEAFGGATVRAADPLHGEASAIYHDESGVFANIPSPTPAGRYHSLVASMTPDVPLRRTARTQDGALMGVRHISRPWHGVQFHPESILTPAGRTMISNFVAMCEAGRCS